ncbi:MAG: hypothetical protein JWL77_5268 [Chthonomonadaceae bacterium]|nr:hypothetical protein [Chthonomonadaceae bacterium]
MLCLSRFVFLPIVGSLLLGGVASAQTAFPVPATATAMIQADGPKQGPNAARYFNVEGKSHGKYMDYGVLRFETKGLKADLDKKFGAGKYKITAVALELTQSNAAFTQDGGVLFYFSPDDKADIKTSTSPLKYPYNPKGALLPGTALGKATFAKSGEKADPTKPHPTDYDLFQGQPGQKALLAALAQGKTVTLIVAEADPAVAATWTAKSAVLNVKAAAK